LENDTTQQTQPTAPTCYRLVVYVADLFRTCYREVANLLWTYYGETGVMDCGLYATTKAISTHVTSTTLNHVSCKHCFLLYKSNKDEPHRSTYLSSFITSRGGT